MSPARITGAFRVEEVAVSRGGRQCVRLIDALEYHVGHAESVEVITVPAGFVTDFASIPRGLWNIFPPLGPWSRAAIIHDFLYATKGTGRWAPEGQAPTRWISAPWDYKRDQADGIFREAMGVLEPPVPGWRRTLMYQAVRAFGGGGWGS